VNSTNGPAIKIGAWIPNPLFPIHRTMQGMRRLIADGVIDQVGVSNYPTPLWRRAESALGSPVLSNQVRYNLVQRRPERSVLPYAQANDRVVMPLLVPSIVAGSVFTFSLSLGDYIAVDLVGGKTQVIGSVVYDNFSADLPFAAAFAVVPVVIMVAFLLGIRRTGALENL